MAETVGSNAVAVAEIAGVRTLLLLAEDAGPSTISSAVVLAGRRDAAAATVFADSGGPVAARLARYFSLPIQVREVVGASSEPAPAEPLPPVLPGPDDAGELLSLIRSHGLETVLEEGVWRGELAGLEVARLARWPIETGGDGLLHIESGVGRFDRDASAAIHGGEDAEAGLRRAIEAVGRHRRRGATPHPVNLMARSRWLRSAAITAPSTVGARELEPVQTTFPASSVRDASPAAALGTTEDARSLVVVFSTGAGLDLVPVAADTRASYSPEAELRLAVPERDRTAVLEELAASLRAPADVVAVAEEWS